MKNTNSILLVGKLFINKHVKDIFTENLQIKKIMIYNFGIFLINST